MAHKIVVGNEKGGAGKSTVSMHVATALARIGHSVGVVDLDLRQKTFGRYMHNRLSHMAEAGLALPTPQYHDVPATEGDEDAKIHGALAALGNRSATSC